MSSSTEGENATKVIYAAPMQESSVESPMDEWSSLAIELPDENHKRILYGDGLYDPGSGDICTKYVSMSASSILRHPYFNYPAVLDPGIKEALLQPKEKVEYQVDGQDLYLAICKDMKQCPVMKFHRGLLTNKIDLKYYCVQPFGVRAMAIALSNNQTVIAFDLTDNFLNDDACFHLGEMLKSNVTLKEFILSGCRIGANGVKSLLDGLLCNKYLQTLNLNKNAIGDNGLTHLAFGIFQGIDVIEIYLSYNNISGKAARILAVALETYNKLTILDLSWNNLYAPLVGTIHLFHKLSESKVLQELYLSWNALAGAQVGNAINFLLKVPSLRVLDLSNNMLSGEGVQNFVDAMSRPKKMVTLNLSYNPLTLGDAFNVLRKMKLNKVKIKNLLLDGVMVNEEFLTLLEQIKCMKSKQHTVITYGGISSRYDGAGPDPRDLILNRVEFLSMKGKKRKVDVALVILQMEKDNISLMNSKAFEEALVATGAPLDSDLINEMVNAFPGSKSTKFKNININLVADFIRRKWPDRQLPPTPHEAIDPLSSDVIN